MDEVELEVDVAEAEAGLLLILSLSILRLYRTSKSLPISKLPLQHGLQLKVSNTMATPEITIEDEDVVEAWVVAEWVEGFVLEDVVMAGTRNGNGSHLQLI